MAFIQYVPAHGSFSMRLSLSNVLTDVTSDARPQIRWDANDSLKRWVMILVNCV